MQSSNGVFSIRQRLLLTSFPLLCLFLFLAGIALDRAYQRAAVESEFRTLQLQAWSLMADAELRAQQLYMPEALQEPAFSLPSATIAGFVLDEAGEILWQSSAATAQSVFVASLRKAIATGRGGDRGKHHEPNGAFVFSQSVTYVADIADVNDIGLSGSEQPQLPSAGISTVKRFTFVVVENGLEYAARLSHFRHQTIFWLALTGLLLLMLQWFALRWSLSPLRQLATDIGRLERGEVEHLSVRYPVELHVVTDNLNQLMGSLRKQRERYRNTLDDLAHSLKTPLSTLRSQLESDDAHQPDSMLEQVSRIDEQISRQLRRISGAGDAALGRDRIALKRLLERLLSALSTVYAARVIDLQTQIDSHAVVMADQADLMEVFGNLLDNAFKYAEGHVRVAVSLHRDDDARHWVLVVIEDDGAGIAADARRAVLQRGVRLDTRCEGQGIGMAVALELVELYGGKMEIATSTLGGAQVQVMLPGVVTME